VKVGSKADFGKGFIVLVEANGKDIAIANVAGNLYAFDDRCPHMGGHLSRGLLTDNMVRCPLHGSQFDVTTGEKKAGPATKPIKTYPVKVQGNEVIVDIT